MDLSDPSAGALSLLRECLRTHDGVLGKGCLVSQRLGQLHRIVLGMDRGSKVALLDGGVLGDFEVLVCRAASSTSQLSQGGACGGAGWKPALRGADTAAGESALLLALQIIRSLPVSRVVQARVVLCMYAYKREGFWGRSGRADVFARRLCVRARRLCVRASGCPPVRVCVLLRVVCTMNDAWCFSTT